VLLRENNFGVTARAVRYKTYQQGWNSSAHKKQLLIVPCFSLLCQRLALSLAGTALAGSSSWSVQ